MDEIKRGALRLGAIRAIRQFEQNKSWEDPYKSWEDPFMMLSGLLGYEDYSEFASHTEKHADILAALAGPHGYAIYKMLKARKNAT